MLQTIINFFKSLFAKKQQVDQPQPPVENKEMTTPKPPQDTIAPKPAIINHGSVAAPDYAYLCSIVKVNSGTMDKNKATFAKMLANKSQYDQIAHAVNCDWQLVAAIHYREASLRPNVYLHNGQTLGQTTTIVPKGIFFPSGAFVEASIDALKVRAKDVKGLQACCLSSEKHNGLGYRKHGVYSPYVWASTNIYTSGMYVADGKFDAAATDKRMGVAAIYLCLAELTK